MLSLLLLTAANAAEPVVHAEPEISNGFRSAPIAHDRAHEPLPTTTPPPNPEPTAQRVFITDSETVAQVRDAMDGRIVCGGLDPYDVEFDHLPLPPNDIEGSLVLVNAWQTPDGGWRLRGGDPWFRLDDVFLRSTLY
jgi:hypothetical protein